MIPFLLELRALMDWMWTDTTLSITSWLQMEDIFANIFILKCWRRSEAEYPFPRGTKRQAVVKYGVGGLLLFILIFIIWFPLLLFSLANTVFESNPPVNCMVRIKLGGFQVRALTREAGVVQGEGEGRGSTPARQLHGPHQARRISGACADSRGRGGAG